MKEIKRKKIISGVVALAVFMSMFVGTLPFGAAAMIVDNSNDEFAWNFSELAVGTPIGENIAAETQNTAGQGQTFFTNIGYRAFAAVHSAGAFGTNNESAGNILADNQSTKWCQGVNANSAWFILDAGEKVKTPYYAIRGANDDMSYASTRVLHTWTVQGGDSADGPWTTISAPTAQGTGWTANYQIRMFDFDSEAIPAEGFRYYRLQIVRYGNSAGGMALGGANNTMQFSYFGLVTGYDVVGSDEKTDYLLPQVASGVGTTWAGSRATMNGPNVVTVNGTVAGEGAAVAAKSYTTIKSGLNVTVHADTKLGYMFAPEGRNATISNNVYDYKYHGAHMAVDLKFSDGTRLKDIPGVIDQYGIGMHPTAQGEGKVLKTYQWNYVESEIGKFAAGKVITDIILGFEMPDATPGYKAAGSFDDIKIFRDGRDYMQIDPADFVDIRQGANSSGNATGALMPAVARPNPFQYWVPTTTSRADANKYAWTSTSMHGVTTSKLASRHMGERLTFLFMANATTDEYTNNNVNNAVNNSNAGFTHDNEFAIYNYHYGVKFNDNDARAPGVTLEVTPTTYGAVFRFTFPAGSAARNVLLAAPHSTTNNYSRVTSAAGNTFAAWCQRDANTNSSTTGSGSLRRNYLYGEFSAQPAFYTPANTSINTLVSFPDLANGPDGSTVVEMRVATSFLSENQAKKNFGMDIVGIDRDDDDATWTTADGKWFDAVKAEAKAEWNALLGSVKIDDPAANYWQLSNFYSKLARANLYPTLLAEYTGEGAQGGWQYASPYRGTNANPVAMDGYMIYNEGWWDTFKSKWPLLGFLRPAATADLTDGIIQHYIDQDGRGTSNGAPQAALLNGHAVPRWINPGGNNMMTGTSSDAVISDMFTTYNVAFDKVMEGYFSWIKSSAVVTSNAAYGGRTGLHEGIFKGYHPWGTSAPAGGGGQLDTTWSLEGYINDAAQVHMLRKMAAEVDANAVIEGLSGAYWKDRWLEEAAYYENRAKNYVNHFDPSQPANYNGHEFTPGWFLNRNRDGSFRKQNPLNWGGGYTEDNAWPYRVLVPQDGRGLANLLGGAMNLPGPQALRVALDEGLGAEGTAMDYVSGGTSSATGGYGGWIHEAYEKREVKLGQFGMSNQTAYHMPWMYLHSDQPWKTQYATRVALARAYSGEAIGYGYMGEEDNGAFASWYVWAALGLYPLDLGSGQLVIGSPTFQKITITNDKGKKITINAPGSSFENLYIQSMKVNGEDYRKLYLEEDLLKQDLVIDYVMGPAPNETWFNEAPPSLTEGDGAPEILTDLTYEGIALTDAAIPADRADAAVSVTNIALAGNESARYLFDDMSSSTGNNSGQQMNKTTYDAKFTARTASIVYYDPVAPKVEMYTLTSSNTANTNPKDWTLSASHDGVEWVELDRRADEIFNWRRYTRPFVIDEEKQGKYRYYKLDITDVSGTENLMLAEVEFLADQNAHADPVKVEIYGTAQSAAAEFSFNNLGDSYSVHGITAVYNENGVLAELQAHTITVAAGGYTTQRFTIGALPSGYTAKAFLWDTENKPLCEPASYVSR